MFEQSNTTSVSLNLYYNDGSPSYYEIEYGPVGFTLGNGTRVNTNTQFSSNYLTVNGMQHSTTYDFYVRAVCNSSAPTDTSNFIKYTYTTVGSCPKPHGLNSDVISGACNVGSGATRVMSWHYDYGTPSSYTVCIVQQGDQPSATANAYTTMNNSIAISGMYCLWKAFYVRANCQNGDSSDWAGPYYF